MKKYYVMWALKTLRITPQQMNKEYLASNPINVTMIVF